MPNMIAVGQNADRMQSGILLMDAAFQPIASDTGALRILSTHNDGAAAGATRPLSIPDEILEAVRDWHSGNQYAVRITVRIGTRAYRCRLYGLLSDHPPLAPLIIAVHLDDASSQDTIHQLAESYHLTEREEEALRAIALGLSTKEVADRMMISPNTVKSFVRLIMIKLSVTSRAAIMVKVMEHTASR